MRTLLRLSVLTCCLLVANVLFAAPPTVHYNLQVLQNATPSQCSDYRGQIAPEENSTEHDSPIGGMSMFGSPGIRACTGCSVNQAGTCVCNKCYDYTDGF